MSIETDLYTQLSTHAGLTALVSTKIYPVLAPQKVDLPYCVYLKVSNVRQYSHQGFSNLERVRLQISCFAKTYSTAKDVAAQVIAAMEAWSASSVQAVIPDGEEDLYEEDTETYHIPLDFIVWYG